MAIERAVLRSLKHIYKIEVQLIYNVVLVFGVQQSDSVIQMHVI